MDWLNQLTSALRKHTSLDEPEAQTLPELGTELVAGFTPGIGTAQALRDYERARRKGDYVGMGTSALSMIPIAGGLAKAATLAGPASKAVLLPIMAGIGKSGAHSKELAEKATEASAMLAAGKSRQEIWDQLGLDEIKRVTNRLRKPTEGIWQYEVPAEGKSFKPSVLMTEVEKHDILNSIDPKYGSPEELLAAKHRLMPQPGVLSPEFAARAIPRSTGSKAKTLGDLSEHPAIEHLPGIETAPMRVYPEGTGNTALMGATRGQTTPSVDPNQSWGSLTLNAPTILAPGILLDRSAPIFEHELQHLIQDRYGLPSGGNPKFMNINSMVDPETLSQVSERLRLGRNPYGKLAAPELASLDEDSYQNYRNLTGEQQARLVQARATMDPQKVKSQVPWDMAAYSNGPTIDSQTYSALLRAMDVYPGMQPDDLATYISQALAKR